MLQFFHTPDANLATTVVELGVSADGDSELSVSAVSAVQSDVSADGDSELSVSAVSAVQSSSELSAAFHTTISAAVNCVLNPGLVAAGSTLYVLADGEFITDAIAAASEARTGLNFTATLLPMLSASGNAAGSNAAQCSVLILSEVTGQAARGVIGAAVVGDLESLSLNSLFRALISAEAEITASDFILVGIATVEDGVPPGELIVSKVDVRASINGRQAGAGDIACYAVTALSVQGSLAKVWDVRLASGSTIKVISVGRVE